MGKGKIIIKPNADRENIYDKTDDTKIIKLIKNNDKLVGGAGDDGGEDGDNAGEDIEEDVIEQEDFNTDEEFPDGDIDSQEELDNPDDEDNKDNETEEVSEKDEEEDDVLEDNYEDNDFGNEADEEGYNRDTCMYNFNKKNDDDDDYEGEYELHFEDDDIEQNNDIITDPDKRESKPILTKYERVRILGDRAKQLSLGAKPMLLNVDNLPPKDIARLELERKVIPFIIEKTLPDGRRERWKVSELEIIN